MTDQEKIQIRFHSKGEYLAPLLLPLNLSRNALSLVLNHLLDQQDQVNYDFLIQNELLKKNLADVIDRLGISKEVVLDVEYFSALKFDQLGFKKEDEWVSAIQKWNDFLITGGYDCMIKVYDCQSMQVVKQVQTEQVIKSIHVVGNVLIVGFMNGQLHGYSLNSDMDLIHTVIMEGHDQTIDCILSIDNLLFTGGWDRKILVWDLKSVDTADSLVVKKSKKRRMDIKTIRPLAELEGHVGTISCLAVKDGELVSGSWDHTIRFWNMNTWESSKVVNLEKAVFSLTCLANGAIITGHEDGSLYVMHGENSPREIRRGHTTIVSFLKTIGDGRFLSAGYDGVIRVWDIKSKKWISTLKPQLEDGDEQEALKILCGHVGKHVYVGTTKGVCIFTEQ